MSWASLNPFDDGAPGVAQLEQRVAGLLTDIQRLQAVVAALEAYAAAVSNAIEIGPDPGNPSSQPAVYPPPQQKSGASV